MNTLLWQKGAVKPQKKLGTVGSYSADTKLIETLLRIRMRLKKRKKGDRVDYHSNAGRGPNADAMHPFWYCADQIFPVDGARSVEKRAVD